MRHLTRSLLLSAAVTPLFAAHYDSPFLDNTAPTISTTVSLGGQNFVNQGLVGVGVFATNVIDGRGDTFGSFSSFKVDVSSWRKNADGSFARGYPSDVTVDFKLLERGQDRYTIYCAPCHGALGDGNGITRSYGMALTPTYHDDRLRGMAEGELFNTITYGKNTMYPYADKLSPDERWAVVAYMRVLQRAGQATINDVPVEQREGLK